jgi:phosphoribosylformylglycinamidine (FGAM) synthase-like amidotransferase family enzyme
VANKVSSRRALVELNKPEKVYVLRGQGIECENETVRALNQLGYKTEFWDIPRLLRSPKEYFDSLKLNDWIFIPGGFSFADHLGSGRLLAFELQEIKFFDQVIEKQASIWGICNGFQVLVAAGIFGNVKLLHNQVEDFPGNFQDRWIKLTSNYSTEVVAPARHGEGRLVISKLAPNTQTCLKYADPDFDNGSVDHIAGLVRQIGKSRVIGTMPHPEIYNKLEQHPDYHFSNRVSFKKIPNIFNLMDQQLEIK